MQLPSVSPNFAIRVISLDRAPERRQVITQELKALGLPYEIHRATDGQELADADLVQYDQRTRLVRFGYDLTPNQIGCYLSHMRCVRAAWEGGVTQLLVLEDDVALSDDFPVAIAEALALADTVECVRLYGARERQGLELARFDSGRRLVRLLAPTAGSQAYLLNRQGMAKLLRAGKSITMPYDMMFDRYWENGRQIHALLPYPVSARDVPSTIGEASPDLWRRDRNHWLRFRLRIGKLVDRAMRTASNLKARLSQRPPILIHVRSVLGRSQQIN